MAVGGAKRGTTRGQRLRECHAEHPACVHALRSPGNGPRSRTAVARRHDRSDALPTWPSVAPRQPLSRSGVRILRHECFKPAQTKSRRACQLLQAELFEQDAEAVICKMKGCLSSCPCGPAFSTAALLASSITCGSTGSMPLTPTVWRDAEGLVNITGGPLSHPGSAGHRPKCTAA